MKANLENLVWEGNSKKMCEAVLAVVPSFMQGGLKKQISSWIKEHNVEKVTEDVFFQVFEDIAPASYQKKLMPELEKLKTK